MRWAVITIRYCDNVCRNLLTELKKQPEILVTGERKRKSFYGAIDVKTGKEQVYVCDRQNQGETIILLDQLKKVYSGRKILLFWDNAPWHRGKKIKRYLRKSKDLELPTSYIFDEISFVFPKSRHYIFSIM